MRDRNHNTMNAPHRGHSRKGELMRLNDVEKIFEGLYTELRELAGENAPSSWTWYAETVPALRVKVHGTETEPVRPDEEPDWQVGSGRVVAWVYECNAGQLVTIGEEASEEQVTDLLRTNMALDA